MNPEVERAVPELLRRGILSEERASVLLRMARDELVSVYGEIRLLLYLGVLTTVAGVSLLVGQHYDELGPVAVAVGVSIAALGCLGWVAWKSPPFSRLQVPSPSPGYDYILLLGVLLASADLAFIEVQFTPLEAGWPWHLFVVSIFMMIVAVRYDSRAVFSLALSTFAAWRGVSVSLVENSLWQFSDESVRWNALTCGLMFALLGRLMARRGWKAHFQPVALHLGWLLILGALVWGGGEQGEIGIAYVVVLALSGAALAWYNLDRGRFVLFSYGMLALYIALNELAFKTGLGIEWMLFWVAVTSLALIAALWTMHRRMRRTS